MLLERVVPDSTDAICSATSILPPNEKVLSLTWVLWLEWVLVSHEHDSATTLLTWALSPVDCTVYPWVTVAPCENPRTLALPRAGSPVLVPLVVSAHWQTGTTITTGGPPGVVGGVVIPALANRDLL